MFKVELFRGEAGISGLAPAWRSLTAKLPLKRHFHRVEWHLALAHTFERHKQVPLHCLAVFIDDTLAAVFPYRPVQLTIGGIELRTIRLVSDPDDVFTARDLIIAPDFANGDFFGGLVGFMARSDPSWEAISLPGILADSIAVTTLKSSRQLPIVESPGGAWGRIEFITCPEGADPFARLSKGFRQNLRTSHNKLDATQVTFECARTASDLARLLPEFLEVESAGWKGELGTSASKQPAMNTFLRQLISHFGRTGGCEIRLMRLSGRPIATLFGVVTDKIWYILRTGYDEAHHRTSPGHLIIEHLLKQREAPISFEILTPYNAPPWFQAWKPDGVLGMSDAFVFRPSPDGFNLAQRVVTSLHNAK
jgi:hypothetical protein